MIEFSDNFDEEKKLSTNLRVGETTRLGVLPTDDPISLTTPIGFPTYFDTIKQSFLEINDDGNIVVSNDSPAFSNDIFLASNNLRIGESIPTGADLLKSMTDSENTIPSAYEILTKVDEEKPLWLTTQSNSHIYLDSVQDSIKNAATDLIVTDPKLSVASGDLTFFDANNQETFHKTTLSTIGDQTLVNPAGAEQIDWPNSFLGSALLPKIDTNFDPLSNIHEELADHKKRIEELENQLENQLEEKDEKIKKLQNQVSKLQKQDKKNSRKIDDTRTDTHETGEFMTRQINTLSLDVEILSALHDDDE